MSYSPIQTLNSIIQFYSQNTCSINLMENLPSLRTPRFIRHSDAYFIYLGFVI